MQLKSREKPFLERWPRRKLPEELRLNISKTSGMNFNFRKLKKELELRRRQNSIRKFNKKQNCRLPRSTKSA